MDFGKQINLNSISITVLEMMAIAPGSGGFSFNDANKSNILLVRHISGKFIIWLVEFGRRTSHNSHEVVFQSDHCLFNISDNRTYQHRSVCCTSQQQVIYVCVIHPGRQASSSIDARFTLFHIIPAARFKISPF